MVRRRRVLPWVLLGTLLAGPAEPGWAAPPQPTLSATVTADAAYWTAGRLDAVAPIAKGPDVATGSAVRRAPAGTPQGQYIAGIPQVGTFFVASPNGNTSCTGSVVHSPGHDLVLTAGHCAYGWQRSATHRIFVPAYVSYRNTVTVIGYPESRHNPGRRAISCTVPTTRLAGYRQMRMVCGGYYDGVSGSPWIANYNATRHTGVVIGEVGGRGGGGDDHDDDWISYSPAYGSELVSLYKRAISQAST